MEKIPVTPTGLKILRARLKQLLEIERPANIRDIATAREHGDLSENAEYHAAKERQSFLEGEIMELQDKLSRTEVIDPTKLSGSRVVFGSTVALYDLDKDEEITYQIVGVEEADPAQHRISYTSPIARALIGKEAGDEITFKAPGGERCYEIQDITFG